MSLQILGGSTSQTVRLFIQDTSKTDGSGLSGLAHNTSGLTAYYAKGPTGAATAITLVSQTPTGAWTSGGFCAVDGTNMAGVYRLDLPNAAVDSEVDTIVILRGAANMAPVPLRIIGRKIEANTLTISAAAVNAIADQVWDEVQSQHTTAGTMGKTLDTLRKSNPVVEAAVLASPAPTATTFSVSGLTYPTGAFKHAVLWFADDATVAEQNSPILTYTNNGDGTSTIVLEEALASAPTAGDTMLIDPTSHVHAVAAIQSGLATAANQTVLIDGMGFVHSVLMGSISDAGTAAETYQISFGGSTYTVDYSGLDATGNRTGATLTKT